MADHDPFAMFGDDEDEDIVETPSEAQKLMELANRRMGQKLHKDETSTNTVPSDKRDAGAATKHVSTFERFNLSWDPPLYFGPIVCVNSLEYGGGREFVAERDLEPGTLILVEKPVVDWSEEQIGAELGLVSIFHILEHDKAQKLLHDLEDFHPTKKAVDEFKQDDFQVKDVIEKLEIELSDGLPALVDLAKVNRFSNRNGDDLDTRDMVRLLLALRYNAFETGVYLHLGMMNHSSYPNSVKFAPTKDYSEVRTTRHVKAGEALTISYLPRIMSHASRRHHLWEQHLFDIGGVVPEEYEELERVGGSIPQSSPDQRDEAAATFRIESVTAALDGHFQDTSEFVAQNSSKENPVWEEAKALEAASLELYTEAKEQLQNDHHLMLIPCLRLHLDLCDLIQIGKILTPSQHVLLLLRAVTSCSKLIALQMLLYGKDHFDLARTYNELSQTLAELLSNAPRQLIELGLEGMNSVAACSAAAHKARKEFDRIRELYPRDAEQYIQQSDATS